MEGSDFRQKPANQTTNHTRSQNPKCAAFRTKATSIEENRQLIVSNTYAVMAGGCGEVWKQPFSLRQRGKKTAGILSYDLGQARCMNFNMQYASF